MKNLLPFVNPTSASGQITLLTLAGCRPELVVAALNAYSMLGIKKDTPISELEDGPNISLSTTDKCDWYIESNDDPDDQKYETCQIYDVNQNHLADTIVELYREDDFSYVNHAFMTKHHGFDGAKHSPVLAILPKTRNSVLLQELALQLSLLSNHVNKLGQGDGDLIFIPGLNITTAVASKEPDIFYGNWCDIGVGFQNPDEAFSLECYNERIYISSVTSLGADSQCSSNRHEIEPE